MNITMYQVDAFAERLFSGNPAAVCLLKEFLQDETMQHIAMENNLAETAFVVKRGEAFDLRWFTPRIEVDLCGHATLASGHVIFNHTFHRKNLIRFNSRSGELTVRKEGAMLVLNFPTDQLQQIEAPDSLIEAIGRRPLEFYRGKTDYMLVFGNQSDIEAIAPDFRKLAGLKELGVIITAKGDAVDFVSRFFAPGVGVDEDPVTGSAHATLTPYWSKKLGKTELAAIQLSRRQGYLKCRYLGERVEIGGKAVTYLIGEIDV